MKRVILTTIILSIFFVAFDLFAAEKILDYGFEDWTGNADTTPGYIFGSSYSSYYTTHKSATEVVSSCGSWTPHSGNYFFYRQHYSGFSDPCLNGGTGTINDHGNIGGSYAYGHNSSFRCSQLGSEIFIKFWFILNAGYSDFGSVASKFVRIYTDAEAVYAHLGGGGQIHLYNRYPSASWGPSISWPGGSPIGDGQWHSFALYANLDGNGTGNGVIKIWLDKDQSQEPTYQDAIHGWGGATRFDHICLQQNFSAQSPTRSTAVGVDDIEIWDGMPTGSTGPNPPKNLRKVPTP